MIVIGDKLIPFKKFHKVSTIQEIKNTPSNSVVLFSFDDEIIKYCFENSIIFAVCIDSVKEAVYANNLGAKYTISKKKLAKKVQKIADNYIFDSRNLAIIESNEEFEKMAKNEIDGIIYKELI